MGDINVTVHISLPFPHSVEVFNDNIELHFCVPAESPEEAIAKAKAIVANAKLSYSDDSVDY